MNMRLRRAPRFDDALAEFLGEKSALDWSADSLRTYKSAINAWHDSGLPADVFLRVYAESHKGSSVNNRRAALRAFFDWQIEKGYLKVNPIERTKPSKVPSRVTRVLERAEIARLIDACDVYGTARPDKRGSNHPAQLPLPLLRARLAAMIAIQATSGIRVSELCGIRFSDVDFAKRSIRIDGKGSKERVVRYGKIAAPRLSFWIDLRAPALRPDEFVFSTAAGTAVAPKVYDRALREVCHWAEVPEISPHILRHSYATMCIDARVPIEDLRAMLGHATVTTTQTYIHRRPGAGFDEYDEKVDNYSV